MAAPTGPSGAPHPDRRARAPRPRRPRSIRAVVGAAILLAFAIAAVDPRLFTPVADPSVRRFPLSLPPSAGHVLGTTAFGQDVWAQLVWGARSTLLVAVLAGVLTSVLSVLVGVTAAWVGGVGDLMLSLLTDVFLVMPAFPLIVILAAYTNGSGVAAIVAIVVATGWSYGARQLRVQALSLRRRDFLDAARMRGERVGSVVVRELLPIMAPLVAGNFFAAAIAAVLAEAGLRFVGLGDPGSVTWGTMMHRARAAEALQTGQEWWIIAPGLCVGLVGAAFALLSSAVDTVATPALRRPGRAAR